MTTELKVAAAPRARRAQASHLTRWLPWAVLALMITLNVAVRLRLQSTPLERDEGEYAYAGQLLLHGIPPYVHAYNMKFPGTYVVYALVMAVFGQTREGVHRGMALITSANTALLFFLARSFWGRSTAAAATATATATAFFALMTLDVRALALSGHATHVVILPAMAGLLLLMRETDSGGRQTHWLRHAIAGVCFGLAILAKQPGAMFAVAAELWILSDWLIRPGSRQFRICMERAFAVGVGSAIPVAVVVFWLWRVDALTSFKSWTIDYARAYGSETSWKTAASNVRESVGFVLIYSHWLWLTGCAGIVAVWFLPAARAQAIRLTILAVCSAVAVSAGFFFRPHYYILLMPAVALGVGGLHIAIEHAAAGRVLVRRMWVVLCIGVGLQFVAKEWNFLLVKTPEQFCVDSYGPEAFNLAPTIGQYLHDHSAASDRVAVFGSEPEIYFYADRISATGYIYTYPLMETQPFAARMQREMANQIEAARPLFIVTVSPWTSWGNEPTSDPWILNWWHSYSSNYEQVADAGDPAPAADSNSAAFVPRHGSLRVAIFRRRPGR